MSLELGKKLAALRKLTRTHAFFSVGTRLWWSTGMR